MRWGAALLASSMVFSAAAATAGPNRIEGRWRVERISEDGTTVRLPTTMTMLLEYRGGDMRFTLTTRTSEQTRVVEGTWQLDGSRLTTTHQSGRVERAKVEFRSGRLILRDKATRIVATRVR